MRVVRSLWYSPSLQFAKVLRDVALSPQFPGQIIIAYDKQSAEHLAACGITHHLIERRPPRGYPPRPSHWWRKLCAVRQAVEIAGGSVLHLDWDTRARGAVPDDPTGPPLQGCLRKYKRTQAEQRHPYHCQVYHGGCFYVRDIATANLLIEMHALRCPSASDEVALVMAADILVGCTLPSAHRAFGCDNPALYRSKMAVNPGTVRPAFSEGKVIRPDSFAYSLSKLLLPKPKRKRTAPRGASRSESSLQQLQIAVDKPSALGTITYDQVSGGEPASQDC